MIINTIFAIEPWIIDYTHVNLPCTSFFKTLTCSLLCCIKYTNIFKFSLLIHEVIEDCCDTPCLFNDNCKATSDSELS